VADPPISGVRLSLWRAAVGFRIVAALVCLYLILRWRPLYDRPGIALAVGGGILLATCVVVVLGLTGRAHRLDFVVADLVVCVGLTLLTPLAQTDEQVHGGMLTLTTIWAAGPVIEVGLVTGWMGGLIAGSIQSMASVAVRGGYDGRTLTNSLLLLICGAVAGYLATRSYRAEQALARSVARQATLEERERLARSIHDGVLQVLGLVHRKGIEAGGEWADLAKEAAEQEAALRALVTSWAITSTPGGERNIAADLVALRSTSVTVSVPQAPVLLSAGRASSLLDIVTAALHNVRHHAGPQARAWILLEDLGADVAVSVRDDGVGMPDGRLEQAAADGRIGVARSIRGRAADLGGAVTITSAPGGGTEVEVVIPAHGPTDSPP